EMDTVFIYHYSCDGHISIYESSRYIISKCINYIADSYSNANDERFQTAYYIECVNWRVFSYSRASISILYEYFTWWRNCRITCSFISNNDVISKVQIKNCERGY